jgi:hypothetical protein
VFNSALMVEAGAVIAEPIRCGVWRAFARLITFINIETVAGICRHVVVDGPCLAGSVKPEHQVLSPARRRRTGVPDFVANTKNDAATVSNSPDVLAEVC